MKRNIKYCLVSLVMLVSFFGCEKDMDEVIHFEATTNATEAGEGVYSVGIDEAILFTDWSTGVDSRTWIFPGGTPASSTEEEVSVTFAEAATDTCTLEVLFIDGTTNSKEFVMLVAGGDVVVPVGNGTEGYSNKDIFSFEDETKALATWGSWSPEENTAELTVDASEGANGTSKSGKVSFTSTGEFQIFTNGNSQDINAKMDKDKKYVLSFWAKATNATTITAALENVVDISNQTFASENQAWTGYLWQDQEIGTEWAKYSFNIDPSNQPYNTAENVYIKIKMLPDVLTEIWLDEFSLMEMVIGEEAYSNRDAFSFEDPSIFADVWAKWENDGAADMTVIETEGANETSNSLEIAFTSAGEVQIFTNQSTLDVNASIDKNKKYIYSFWAKASEKTTITAALENPEPWVSLLWQDQEIGTDWVKYSFDIDPGSKEYEGTADNVYVKVKMVPTNGNTKIWLDEFSLREKIIQ